MRWSEQADDLVTMFTDVAWKPRLRLAFEGRRAAIWPWPIPSPFVRRMARQSLFDPWIRPTGRGFGDDV
jgi:hypothetical protein